MTAVAGHPPTWAVAATTYKSAGCRCEGCTAAHARYERTRRNLDRATVVVVVQNDLLRYLFADDPPIEDEWHRATP